MPYESPEQQAANARSSAIVSLQNEYAKYCRAPAVEGNIKMSPKHKHAINLVRGAKSAGLKLSDIVPHTRNDVEIDAVKSDAFDYLEATGQTV